MSLKNKSLGVNGSLLVFTLLYYLNNFIQNFRFNKKIKTDYSIAGSGIGLKSKFNIQITLGE